MQTLSPSQASAEVPINENFQTLIHQEVYGKKQSTTTGLTWGYWGGRWAGFLIADGTLALTASATNYIVVLRSTGAISVSTAVTNWNDTNSYQRVYQLTTSATAVTATEDHRAGQGGVHGYIAVPDEFVNAQTGISYTYVTTDKGKLVTHSNAAAIAGTLPQAGASFPAGWWVDVQNRGAGTLTITPTTSTVDGAASLVLTTAQGVRLASDGVNYFTQRGKPFGVVAVDVSNTPAGNIAAITVQAAINELDSEKQAALGFTPENSANKDASGGYAGLTLFKLNLRNAANTITSWFTTATTVARTWTLPDKDGTVAMTSDLTAAAISNTPAAGVTETNVQGAINGLEARKANALTATRGAFVKDDAQSVAFAKTGAGTVSLKAGTYVDVAGTLITFATATAITMPALTAGTDYAIYACTDGSVRADASFSAPSGYTTANSRKIGGFHYSPGGHSGVSGGGNVTPQINEYSFWDIKFKPACLDPRGMVLVADGFWSDIYLLGVEHVANGTSKYNVTIADGASPPKIPTKYGGDGTTAYASLTWWEAGEVLAGYGKRLPSYTEFAALAYGTTEAVSIGADPVSTTWAAAYISKWGCAQSTGNLWVWGANFGGGTAAAGWVANTVGRGSTYQLENAAIFGGGWGDTLVSGSRCSIWANSPTLSSNNIGARGVADLLILE